MVGCEKGGGFSMKGENIGEKKDRVGLTLHFNVNWKICEEQ